MYNVLLYDFRYRPGHFILFIGVLLYTSLILGCDSGTAPSIYDPSQSSLPDPVIEQVVPQGSALAGVDEITITGTNFSTQPGDNLVYFGTDRGDVLEASATQLRVFAPNSPQPGLQLRMSVVGAENFSNSVSYRLDPPFIEFGDIKDFENIYGIATDQSGNLYVSLAAFNLAVGIIQITPEGERSEFISSTFPWTDIEFGSDNTLYAVRSVRALFRSLQGVANFEVFAVIPNASTQLNTMAVDPSNRIWAAGNNADIYRIDPDKSIKTYAFESDIRDVALFRDFLYVAGIQGQVSGIWRFAIDSNGDLGPVEKVYDLTSIGVIPHAIAFSVSGYLYVGIDDADPVLLIDPDGTGSVLYPDVLPQPAREFAWGKEGHLYAATTSSDANPSGIIRITTRRLGYGKRTL